jgi:hypothetical protein
MANYGRQLCSRTVANDGQNREYREQLARKNAGATLSRLTSDNTRIAFPWLLGRHDRKETRTLRNQLAPGLRGHGDVYIFVRPFGRSGGKWRISTGGGKFPMWSRTGHELFYFSLGDGRIMIANYRAQVDSFSAARHCTAARRSGALCDFASRADLACPTPL